MARHLPFSRLRRLSGVSQAWLEFFARVPLALPAEQAQPQGPAGILKSVWPPAVVLLGYGIPAWRSARASAPGYPWRPVAAGRVRSGTAADSARPAMRPGKDRAGRVRAVSGESHGKARPHEAMAFHGRVFSCSGIRQRPRSAPRGRIVLSIIIAGLASMIKSHKLGFCAMRD